MPLQFVTGDVLQTRAAALLIGLNERGRQEVNPLEVALRDRYPVFFSEYRRLAKSGRLSGGHVWIFHESRPWLIGAVVRTAPSGATRLRYLEGVLLNLRRDYSREQITSLAVASMGDASEWAGLKSLFRDYLAALPIPVIAYETYQAGVIADEALTSEINT